MSLYNGEAPVVCLSVRLSCLSVNVCANRFFSQANGRIATKLSQDGLQVNVHPGCAQGQGQGQRSRDRRTFLDSWNELLRHWRSGFCVYRGDSDLWPNELNFTPSCTTYEKTATVFQNQTWTSCYRRASSSELNHARMRQINGSDHDLYI